MDIRAYDLGEPQLSSVMTVPVYVRHVATVPPEVGLAFADDIFTANVPENAANGSLVKTLTILNNHVHTDIPLKCNIAAGNDEGMFRELKIIQSFEFQYTKNSIFRFFYR